LTHPLGESLFGNGRSDPDFAQQSAELEHSTTDSAGRGLNLSASTTRSHTKAAPDTLFAGEGKNRLIF